MKLLYIKTEKNEELIYENYEYFDLRDVKCIYISNKSNARICFDFGSSNPYQIDLESEFVSSRVIEYIMAALFKGIEMLNISEFVLDMERLDRKNFENKKKKKELLEYRKKQSVCGLSFPEYEFKEGALSMYHKYSDEGKLSIEE